MTKAECILCGTCADVCPEKVISFSFICQAVEHILSPD
ncbi:MAG: 4Fe-4S binding protein [Candidatus Aminicenantes bacterium]|nr:4Fe-4S binding protein [Candidatus Aminicenantes bacterium]